MLSSGTPSRREHLALQVGELGVEDLDGVAVMEQRMALGEAEQAQDLLGGGATALSLLGVDAAAPRCRGASSPGVARAR
ncbi:MAG: hypothetical protein MZW92_16530 [Comamonadaceae bacterium]|nr:hypothetical protein [Comamonadaceae bacterium]